MQDNICNYIFFLRQEVQKFSISSSAGITSLI